MAIATPLITENGEVSPLQLTCCRSAGPARNANYTSLLPTENEKARTMTFRKFPIFTPFRIPYHACPAFTLDREASNQGPSYSG